MKGLLGFALSCVLTISHVEARSSSAEVECPRTQQSTFHKMLWLRSLMQELWHCFNQCPVLALGTPSSTTSVLSCCSLPCFLLLLSYLRSWQGVGFQAMFAVHSACPNHHVALALGAGTSSSSVLHIAYISPIFQSPFIGEYALTCTQFVFCSMVYSFIERFFGSFGLSIGRLHAMISRLRYGICETAAIMFADWLY